MKKIVNAMFIALGLVLFLIGGTSPVGAASHMPIGGDGVMGPSCPPPGFHFRMYNTFIHLDKMMDDNGDKANIDFNLDVFVTTLRPVYITKKKILGADYGFNMVIPIVSQGLKITAPTPGGPITLMDDSTTGIADILFEPLLLGWHKPRYDAMCSLAGIAPTGRYDANKLSPGEGYWSVMWTMGGTLYLDKSRTWTASLITHFVKNFEQKDTNITFGSEFGAEWGIGKEFPITKYLLLRPGIMGYGYWQVSDDHGFGTTGLRGRKYAIGAEINLFCLPPTLFQVNLKVMHEFGTRNRPEGDQVFLILTKSF